MLKVLRFNIGDFFNGYEEVRLQIYKQSAKYEITFMNLSRMEALGRYEKKRFLVKDMGRLSEWDSLNVNIWRDKYVDPICDGIEWELTYREDGKKKRFIHGSNSYPPQWNQFIMWLDALMPEMQFANYIDNAIKCRSR